MSKFEDSFMAGFNGALSKTAEETPILDKALSNLGLLEEAPAEEEIEMPILKQALDSLGLTEEEGGEKLIEASSMLEALAIKHGPAVVAEREKLAALEKEAKPKKVFALGGIPEKKGLMARVKSFASKHPGKFKIGAGAGAGALGAGATALALRKKKDKKDKKKGK